MGTHSACLICTLEYTLTVFSQLSPSVQWQSYSKIVASFKKAYSVNILFSQLILVFWNLTPNFKKFVTKATYHSPYLNLIFLPQIKDLQRAWDIS